MHTSSMMLLILSQHSVSQLTADLTQSPESGAHLGRMTCRGPWSGPQQPGAGTPRSAHLATGPEAWLSRPGLRAHRPARACVHTCTQTYTPTYKLTHTAAHRRTHTLTDGHSRVRFKAPVHTPRPTQKATSPCGCPPAHRPHAGPSCLPRRGLTCTCCSRCWAGPLHC